MSYEIDWVVEHLHQIPHFNFSFLLANSTFDPGSLSYRESIIFLALLPLCWCILVLIITSICLCVQCHKKKPKQKTRTTCLRLITAVFIILSIGGLAVAFYGNEESNKGIQSTVDAIQDTNETVEEALSTLNTLVHLANNVATSGVSDLQTAFNNYLINYTVKTIVSQYVNEIRSAATQVQVDINGISGNTAEVSFDYIADFTGTIEFYRWIGTIVLCSWQVLVLLVYIVGNLKKSKCWLVWAIIFGFVSLLLVWAAAGVYLGGSVAVSDFCYDPKSYVISQGDSPVAKGIIQAYIECTNKRDPQNFSQAIEDAIARVSSANITLTKAINLTLPFNISAKIEKPVRYIRDQLSYTQSNITSLSDAVFCQHIHGNYIKALNGICTRALVGVTLILVVLPIMGICLIFIQCFAPRIWLLLGTRKGYDPVDVTDPFLPRPPPYNGYGSMGHDEARTSLHDSSLMDSPRADIHNEPHPGTPLSESPPPSYYAGSFVDQYNNLRPSSSIMGTFPTRASQIN
ncbi:hypothetical protein CHS0354_001018 [Potamilus streckersoni]|uniref:Protein tweety homolog n=1 Tax=Potamilus streckersoni TaxID=2493646 RepID=A0AAE0VJM1_9BIVA|nr:hypothetical protein CHS0354_001018 [Potamilus streckersoni]